MRTIRLSRPALAVGVAAAGAVATAGPAGYVLFFRRWCLTWGARDDEVAAKLPGDELLPDAGLVTTRAVTIDAPPEAIWPWLVQMGSGRGGAYSYDWIENLLGLNMHSADEILPRYQHIAVGDELPMGSGRPGMTVEVLDPPRHPRRPGRRPELGVDLRAGARRRVDQADQPQQDRDGGSPARRPAFLHGVHGARQPDHGAQDAARHQTARRAYRRRSR